MARGGSVAASSRGRGKFRSFTRGGGKNFSRNTANAESSMWADPAENSDESSEEEDSEEEKEDNATAEASREIRKAEKKARKEAALAKKSKVVNVGDLPPSDSEEEPSDDMPVKANYKNLVTVEQVTQDIEKMGLNRKEREAAKAAEAKLRYQKLHEAGKTDEAKNDLARLRIIREKRAAEAAQRLAEKEEREAQETHRKKELDSREAKRREAALRPTKKSKK